ncbi:MAG: hypothetical protein ABSC57_10550, partial [Syntrophales bacterium]
TTGTPMPAMTSMMPSVFGDDEAFAQLMRRHVGVKGECSPLLSRKWGIAMNSPCLPGGIH